MRQQTNKKAVLISAILTAFILVGVVSLFFAQKGWSLALTNPIQIQSPQIEAQGIANETTANLQDTQEVAEQPVTEQMTTLDPSLEAALDTTLDPNMDPALKESLKSALRSALDVQTFPTLTTQMEQPPIVVTVEPIVIPGQEQVTAASASGQWSTRTGADPVSAAPVTVAPVSGPSVDQVAAAYKAQLEEAYAALQTAYDQIGAMQSTQSAPAATNINNNGRNEHEEREHEDGEHEGGEHGDD